MSRDFARQIARQMMPNGSVILDCHDWYSEKDSQSEGTVPKRRSVAKGKAATHKITLPNWQKTSKAPQDFWKASDTSDVFFWKNPTWLLEQSLRNQRQLSIQFYSSWAPELRTFIWWFAKQLQKFPKKTAPIPLPKPLPLAKPLALKHANFRQLVSKIVSLKNEIVPTPQAGNWSNLT